MPRGIPGTATLRVSTSPQMITTIASSARLATSASASSSVPNRASRRSRPPAFIATERSPARAHFEVSVFSFLANSGLVFIAAAQPAS